MRKEEGSFGSLTLKIIIIKKVEYWSAKDNIIEDVFKTISNLKQFNGCDALNSYREFRTRSLKNRQQCCLVHDDVMVWIFILALL